MLDFLKELKAIANRNGCRGRKQVCNYLQRNYFTPCICKFWKDIK